MLVGVETPSKVDPGRENVPTGVFSFDSVPKIYIKVIVRSFLGSMLICWSSSPSFPEAPQRPYRSSSIQSLSTPGRFLRSSFHDAFHSSGHGSSAESDQRMYKSKLGCLCLGLFSQFGVCIGLLRDLHHGQGHCHHRPRRPLRVGLFVQDQQALGRV